MKKIILILFCLYSGIFCLVGLTHAAAPVEKTTAVTFADYVLQRWPDPTSINANGWEYNTGIVLMGLEKVYEKTKDPKYLRYVQRWVDHFVDNQGKINFNKTENNLDRIQPGLLLFLLYRETHQEKYKKAATFLRNALATQPRNADGGFWHKGRYPNEMWLDGIYMAEPFLIQYGDLYGEQADCTKEATFQTILIANHTQDPKTGLLYHGWSQDKKVVWADPTTGLSKVFWCRGTGWYAMALVEMLPYIPKDQPQYGQILDILKKLAVGIKATQDPNSGLWYQVLDQRERPDNWPETSGSLMFIYALKTAVNNGYLDNSYLSVVNKGWEGIKTKISLNKQNLPEITGTVEGMGVQDGYDNYINKQTAVNLTQGLCGILYAASVMEY